MRRGLLLLLPACLLLGLAVYAAWVGWGAAEGVTVSWHGYLALGLGILVTLVLTAGLVALILFSHARGYDR